jgi:hypothetical protein
MSAILKRHCYHSNGYDIIFVNNFQLLEGQVINYRGGVGAGGNDKLDAKILLPPPPPPPPPAHANNKRHIRSIK